MIHNEPRSSEVQRRSLLCNGTVVSRQQYLVDVQQWGYEDGRLQPHGNMTAQEIAQWTDAIGKIK